MAELAHNEEVLDLVDKDDSVVGTITHDKVFDWANLEGNFLRASNAFIVNSNNEVWIPQRTATKSIKPSGLDYSCGEHVMAGEAYIDAMVRGFDEELNITLTPKDLIFIGTTAPLPGRPPYFEANYIFMSDETPNYNSADFSNSSWITPAMLQQAIEAHPYPSKENLDRAIELVATFLAERSSNQ